VGVDAQGRLGAPSRPELVGWYERGPSPGEPGDAVIDGHLDWTCGPAVFWQLRHLRVGDEATVTGADGSRLRFVVDSVTAIPYNANIDPLFVTSGPPTLTLLTCNGTWDRQRATYLQRLVVHLSLPPPPPSQKPAEAG
jgi:LPXTG-site transpeptidase (sortase) family protein